MKIKQIRMVDIRADQRAQPRVAMLPDRVAEYIEDMGRGDQFPPPIVFQDKDGICWLADGFHRYHAAIGLQRKKIECDVRKGDLRAAVLYSCGVNAAHGLRRTNADKRQAVTKMLADDEWSHWSDREIAKRCNVSDTLVLRIRQDLAPVTASKSSERTYTTKHGTDRNALEALRRAYAAVEPIWNLHPDLLFGEICNLYSEARASA
jgi:hypothetical protein